MVVMVINCMHFSVQLSELCVSVLKKITTSVAHQSV